jgi:hypothetical protein
MQRRPNPDGQNRHQAETSCTQHFQEKDRFVDPHEPQARLATPYGFWSAALL